METGRGLSSRLMGCATLIRFITSVRRLVLLIFFSTRCASSRSQPACITLLTPSVVMLLIDSSCTRPLVLAVSPSTSWR